MRKNAPARKLLSASAPFRDRSTRLCATVSLVLAFCLPFVVPFDAARNIDVQGILLIIAGGLTWLSLALGRSENRVQLGRPLTIVLVIFILSSCISLVTSPHLSYDLWGAPLVRLGTLGLISCIGLGRLAQKLPIKPMVAWLYVGIVILGLASIPYSLLRFHSLQRIPGIFAQADIFAAFLGCGLLLGWYIFQKYRRWRYLTLISQIFLTSLLVMTGTRAVLLLMILLSIVWFVQNGGVQLKKSLFLYPLVAVLIIGGLLLISPGRLADFTADKVSLDYRLSLQTYALQASVRRPWWGYGPGNLADALSCPTLKSQALQTTCRQGYFFNSSHDIFIDRFLAVGWLGGVAYLVFVVWTICRGLRAMSTEVRIFAYTALLIAGYYLTNVTSLTLELLFWVVLLSCLRSRVSEGR